jgi:triosephosphate isomerase
MIREPLIAANWKMHKGPKDAVNFLYQLIKLVGDVKIGEVAIIPPFVDLPPMAERLEAFGSETNIVLGAQNMYPEKEGAFTGEISPLMLQELKCKYVILGHSERRQYFQESDAFIQKKVKMAKAFDLIPILCIGEKEEERDQGRAEEIVTLQLEGALREIEISEPFELVIAYEPVWAIGTGRTATPEDAQAMHAHIRYLLTQMYGETLALGVRILYGGSVKPNNVVALMAKTHIDGALVGGASLDVESFVRIIHYRDD